MSRKPHAPTDETRKLVTNLALSGVPQADIAKHVGISVGTLAKYYSKELAESGEVATARVCGELYSNCLNGNVSAQIFWMKTRGGWRVTNNHDHTSSDGSLNFVEALRTIDAAAKASKSP